MLRTTPDSPAHLDSSATFHDDTVTRMRVLDRHGVLQPVDLNRIVAVITACCDGLSGVDPMRIATKTISGLNDGVSTRALNELSIDVAHMLMGEDPDYSKVAARLLARMVRRDVEDQGIRTFSQGIEAAFDVGLIDKAVRTFVRKHKVALDNAIDLLGDLRFEYLGAKTLADRYVLKHPTTRMPLETFQHFLMRDAVGTSATIEEALQVYSMYSTHRYMSATPTLLNSGTTRSQLSSCFVLDSPKDDLGAIYDADKDIALLSKYSGGIGISYSSIRSAGSLIKGTNGFSNGIIPFLKKLDVSVAAVNQGGVRKGACAVYLEPWHADIEAFLDLRNNTGDHASRAHTINLAVWAPDVFMERVENNGPWSLFSPSDFPQFPHLYGQAFRDAYSAAEASGKARKVVQARDLYAHMMRTLSTTGEGWLCFKDRMNETSNQTLKSENVIHSSNLCVAPETTILTYEHGEKMISELKDQEVHAWNGKQFSLTRVVQTGEQVALLKVTVERAWRSADGLSDEVESVVLHCTPYHKWIRPDGSRVETKDLEVDQPLRSFSTNLGKSFELRVLSVEDEGRVDDTYCVNEPREHAAMFNGILTGQCVEIALVNKTQEEASVCNLASINLAAHVDGVRFDFVKLVESVEVAIKQLNRVIDRNFYTIKETKTSNMRWRPVGLGLMGLQDVFFALRMPFDSAGAKELSTQIQACMYYTALRVSMELAQEEGPCEAFQETRLSQGVFSFEHWGVAPPEAPQDSKLAYDWEQLRADIMKHGTRNSLLLAIAPTATIASIVGVYECIEPQVANVFRRETMSGDFMQINRALVTELKTRGLWTHEVREELRKTEGSIQSTTLPDDIKALYRTVWELPMRVLIDLAAARTPFIDQSQSLNLYQESPTVGKLSSMYMYAWKSKLKTTYYLRSRPATKVVKATTVKGAVQAPAQPVQAPKVYNEDEELACSIDNKEACEACQ